MSTRLIVELDGGQHASQTKHDQYRTTYLHNEGYEVIRFWNSDVMNNLEGVLMTLMSQSTAHQSLSPIPFFNKYKHNPNSDVAAAPMMMKANVRFTSDVPMNP